MLNRTLAVSSLVFLSAQMWAQPQPQLDRRGLTPNGFIYTMKRSGSTMYVGGLFDKVGLITGGQARFLNGKADSLDFSFPHINGIVYTTIPDGNGGWYVGGTFLSIGGISQNALGHILPDYSVDQTFNLQMPLGSRINALLLSGDTLYVGGLFSQIGGQAIRNLAAVNVATKQVTSFQPDPNGEVRALDWMGDGLLAGGTFTRIGAADQPGMAWIDVQTGQRRPLLGPESGFVNTFTRKNDSLFVGGTFNGPVGLATGRAAFFAPGANAPNQALAAFNSAVDVILPDGQGGWFVGGAFTRYGDSIRARLAHIFSDFSLDPAFNYTFTGSVSCLDLSGDTLILGGTFTAINGQARGRLAAIRVSDGALLPWAPQADGNVSQVKIAGAHVFVGGLFNKINQNAQPRLAKVHRFTGMNARIPSPGLGEVKALGWSDDTMFVGGSFSGAAGLYANRAARFLGGSDLPDPDFLDLNLNVHAILPDGSGGWYVGGVFTLVNGAAFQRLAHILPNGAPNPAFAFNVNGQVNAIYRYGDTLLIAGAFTQVNGQARGRMAAIRISTQSLLPWDPNLGGTINDLTIRDGKVYAGGVFSSAGGQPRNRLAAYDLATGALQAWNPNSSGAVSRLESAGNRIVVLGSFISVGGVNRQRLAEIDPVSGAVGPLDLTINNSIEASLRWSDDTMFIGGSFTQINGQGRSRLAGINLATGSLLAWNPGADNTVHALSVSFSDDTMFVGGNFTSIGGQPNSRLAKVSVVTGAVAAWRPDPSGIVYAIGVQGTDILVGGAFSAMKSKPRSRMMALSPTGELTDWDPSPNNTVEALWLDGGEMIVGGAFTQIGGQSRNRLAKVSRLSGGVAAWNPNADGNVLAITQFNDTVFVGGAFNQIGGQAINRLAKIDRNTGQPFGGFVPAPSGPVNAVSAGAGGYLAGGAFGSVRAKDRARVFGLNTSTLGLLDFAPQVTGIAARVNRILPLDDTTFVLAGAFTGVGGVPLANLAFVNENGTARPGTPGLNGEGYALELWAPPGQAPHLYIGGDFTEVQGQPIRYGVGLDPTTLQPGAWQPQPDFAFRTLVADGDHLMTGGGFTMMKAANRKNMFALDLPSGRLLDWDSDQDFFSVDLLEIDQTRPIVYAHGFINQGTVPHLAALDANTGERKFLFDPQLNGKINYIAQNPSTGDLYIGGAFNQVNGQGRSRFAVLDTSGTLKPFTLAFDGEVRKIIFQPSNQRAGDSLLWMSGAFSTVNGQARTNLAAVTLSGDVLPWNPLDTVTQVVDVHDLAVVSDRVYVAGGSGQGLNRSAYLAAFHPVTGERWPWKPEINGNSVRRVVPFGDRVFIAGDFSGVGSRSTGGLASLSTNSGLLFDFLPDAGFSGVQDIALFQDKLWIGGVFTQLNNAYHPHFAVNGFRPGAFTARIASTFPESGGNIGDVTLRIIGGGLVPGTKISLVSASLPPIFPYDTATLYYGGSRLETTFDLRGAPLGMRDIVIEIPGDTTIVLPNAFEIVEGIEPFTWADIVVPPRLRSRLKSFFYLTVGNSGNVDAHGVPVFLALSPNLEIVRIGVEKIKTNFSHPSMDSIPEFFRVDTIAGEYYPSNVYAYIFPKIPAGGVVTVRIALKADAADPNYYARAWASDPMHGSPLKYVTGECADQLLSFVLGFVPGVGCAYSILDLALSPLFDYSLDPSFGSEAYVGSYAESWVSMVVGCALDLATGGVARVVLEIADVFLKAKSGIGILDKCYPPQKNSNRGGDGEGIALGSLDPNDKTGPPGKGGLGWLATDRRFSYLVRFENDSTATAPANEVVIRDTLDLSVFNLKTLELIGFSVADTFFRFPYGRSAYSDVVDLRPRLPMLLRCETQVDSVSGELLWRLVGLDPETYQIPADPLDGFLPPLDPTDTTAAAQGSVLYNIFPHDTLSSGRAIVNAAAIYFDANPPIFTDPYVLTADNHRPVSTVNPLPDTIFQSPVTISWSGSDIGAGIESVDILVRINGDRWRHAAIGLETSSFEFDVLGGNYYEFYSVAYDTAQNRELIPKGPEAAFFAAAGVSVDPTRETPTVKLYPNPNRGAFALELETPRAGHLEVRVLDLQGRSVWQKETALTAGTHQENFYLQLPSGLYLVHYRMGDWEGWEKVLISN